MTEFVLVPGAGGEAWYWSRVVPALVERGHTATAVELPAADEEAGLYTYTDVILDAIGGRSNVVLVAQSMGAFSAPMAAMEVDVAALLLVVPMIPATGESVEDWWATTKADYGRSLAEPFDTLRTFFHDVPEDVVAEAFARGEPQQSGRATVEPWPLDAWPEVPTRVLVGRHDRLFPYDFAREVCRDRLGLEPDTIDTGHLPALAKPRELAAWLAAVA